MGGVPHEGPGRDGDARVRGDEWPVGAGEGPVCEDQVLLFPLMALMPLRESFSRRASSMREVGTFMIAAVRASPWGVATCQHGRRSLPYPRQSVLLYAQRCVFFEN